MAFEGRITVWFEQGNYGWTEVLLNNAADYAQLFIRAGNYCAVRQTLLAQGTLGDGPKIMGFRISDNTKFRDAEVQFFQPPLQGTFSGNPIHPTTALLVRLSREPYARRPLYLRGLPASILNANGAYNPIGAWGGVFNDFRNHVLTSGYLIKGQLQANPPARTPINIIAPPNVFSTSVAHGLNVRDIVRLVGFFRHRNYPRGLFKVNTTAPPTGFTLAGVDLPADFGYVPGDLSVQLQDPQLSIVNVVSDERLTERRTGRPFDLPRGRRALGRA